MDSKIGKYTCTKVSKCADIIDIADDTNENLPTYYELTFEHPDIDHKILATFYPRDQSITLEDDEKKQYLLDLSATNPLLVRVISIIGTCKF